MKIDIRQARDESIEYTCVGCTREAARVIKAYCIRNGQKMQYLVSEILIKFAKGELIDTASQPSGQPGKRKFKMGGEI